MIEKKSLTVDEQLPAEQRRIDKIARALTGLSVRQGQGLFDAGGVQLNGAVCREPWKWLAPGDRVDVGLPAGPVPGADVGVAAVVEDE
jgi:hypothetical protein